MKLRTQLIFAFGIVASIPMVGGAVGYYAQRDAVARAREALAASQAARDGVDAARRAQAGFTLQQQTWSSLLGSGNDQQARGLEQAVSSMHRIDQLTQSNTAAAEGTATAAQQLESEASELRSKHPRSKLRGI